MLKRRGPYELLRQCYQGKWGRRWDGGAGGINRVVAELQDGMGGGSR